MVPVRNLKGPLSQRYAIAKSTLGWGARGQNETGTYTKAKKTPVQPSNTSQAHNAGNTFDFPLQPTISPSVDNSIIIITAYMISVMEAIAERQK